MKGLKKKKKVGEKKKKAFSFSPPSRRLTSHEPWSHRRCQKTAQPTAQRTAPVSLRCFKLFFIKKTRAFLDVLSDLYQADTSHKVPRRSGKTHGCRWVWFPGGEIGLESRDCYPGFLLFFFFFFTSVGF